MIQKRVLLAALAAAGVLALWIWLERPRPDITRAEALAIAQDAFEVGVADFKHHPSQFLAPVIREHEDGWAVDYPAKDAPESALGLFVERDGSVEYTSAPDILDGRDLPPWRNCR